MSDDVKYVAIEDLRKIDWSTHGLMLGVRGKNGKGPDGAVALDWAGLADLVTALKDTRSPELFLLRAWAVAAINSMNEEGIQ
jgi:hypothetical protein